MTEECFMLKGIGYGAVKMNRGLFRERMDANRRYLLELDSECLLQNFYTEAGIIPKGGQSVESPEKASFHWGWEAPSCQLRGHFMGHYLSAAAQYYAWDNDKDLKQKLDYLISRIHECQRLNGGEWAGPIPEKYFDILTTDRYIWSPQYTMHKLLMGLIHAKIYAGNDEALEILSGLADWYKKWIKKVESINPDAVFRGEAAGMLEIWALCYEVTKDKRYLELAEIYGREGLLQALLDGKDPLTNGHTNASIPYSHGAAKMYEVTGDEKWLGILENFWQHAVTERGYFSTSGMNAGEFWIPKKRQGHYMVDNNQEFCTVFNMVRTAEYLYRFTGDKKYGDYIERALYNGFLAQQNPRTGMPSYFLPMRAGGRKKWGSKTHDFWCCHGTMIQSQILYPELIYLQDGERRELLVSQYIPSSMTSEFDGKRFKLTQSTGMKYYNDVVLFDEKEEGEMLRWMLNFGIENECGDITVKFRIPWWITDTPRLFANGKPVTDGDTGDANISDISVENGYIKVTFGNGTTNLGIFFPNGLVVEELPDYPELTAIMDGPVVLAGLTDKDCGLKLTGEIADNFAQVMEHTYSTFPWRQTCYRTRGQEQNFELRPLYEIGEEPYTVYFTRKQQ